MEEKKIDELIKKHDEYRHESINLIPSENVMKKDALLALSSDLATRYGTEWYGGSEYAGRIYEKATNLAKKLFNVRYAIINPISGNICDLAALFSFTKPYDEIAVIPKENGGYPFGYKKFHRKKYSIPMKEYEVDVEHLVPKKFPLILLAQSTIFFPLPINKIKENFDGICIYDASHVLGLIAGKKFQNPLEEGCNAIIGSTHKTFPGPQGGIVLTNDETIYEKFRQYLLFDFDLGIGLIDNMHMNRIASLAIVFEEMMQHGKKYAHQILKNARILASHLHENGIAIKYVSRGYTQTHQILLDMDKNHAFKFFKKLEQNRIFIDCIGRIGVAETTHIGMKEKEMEEIAEMMIAVYEGKNVKEKAMELARKFYGNFYKK